MIQFVQNVQNKQIYRDRNMLVAAQGWEGVFWGRGGMKSEVNC